MKTIEEASSLGSLELVRRIAGGYVALVRPEADPAWLVYGLTEEDIVLIGRGKPMSWEAACNLYFSLEQLRIIPEGGYIALARSGDSPRWLVSLTAD